MGVYVSPAMREVMGQMDAEWSLCVRDYQAWLESGEQQEPVSPIVVGQLLSAGLVGFVGHGTVRESRYGLTDTGRTVLRENLGEVR